MEPNKNNFDYELPKLSVAEAQDRVLTKIASGTPDLAAKTIEEYHLSPDFIASPEVQQAIMDQLVYLYSYGFADAAPEFLTTHLATPEVLHQAQLRSTIEAFTQANFDDLERMTTNGFAIPEDILHEPTVQQALQAGLARPSHFSSDTLDRYRQTWQRS